MTRRRRRVSVIAAVVAAAVTATAAFLTLPAASAAEVDFPTFATTSNGSDPEVIFCNHPTLGSGYCMVTSQDLRQPGIYPMNKTVSYFSRDGIAWQYMGNAIEERDLVPYGAAQANHLWAPALIAGWGGDNNNYYLYTPALTNASNHLSSRIFVSRSSNPSTGFRNSVLGQVTGAPSGLYMSDPFVFREFRTANSPHYLVWADGDGGTCGGISMRRMTSATSIEPFTNPSQVAVTINGIGVLGNCGGKGRPYLEGASLYQFDRWNIAANPPKGGLPGKYTLVFAAKPTSTPAECQQPGQPNTANSVLAYATSNTVTGPYTYRGIIMCGSKDEWTNQASIVEVKAANGEWRLMLVYHDGAKVQNQVRSRYLRSECLYTMDNKFLNVMRTGEGAASVHGYRQWCLNAPTVVAIRSYHNGKFVRSDSGGVMTASKATPGTWEEFTLEQSGGITYFNAHNPINKWVQANRGNNTIMARGESKGEWERFTLHQLSVIPNGVRYGIRDSQGKWVRVDDTGKLVLGPVANGVPNHSSYYFDVIFLST